MIDDNSFWKEYERLIKLMTRPYGYGGMHSFIDGNWQVSPFFLDLRNEGFGQLLVYILMEH